MFKVSRLFRSRWRSLKHVQEAKPYQRVEIRYGKFERDYRRWHGEDMSHIGIPGRSSVRPWSAWWVPQSDWVEVPNVLEFETRQSFDDDGVEQFTLIVENVKWQQFVKGEKFYHVLLRGFMSPWRGYNSKHRPKQNWLPQNEWYQYLTRACQIRVWQGYGPDTAVEVFTGMIDAFDSVTLPDRITIVGRDYGQVLQDQRAFAWNIDRHMSEFPPVFQDRMTVHGEERVGSAGPNDKSTWNGFHGAKNVADTDARTYWESGNNLQPDFTEYVQVRLPKGIYEKFDLHPLFAGMELWVSVYAHGPDVRIDGVQQPEGWTGWIDLGMGDVPGEIHGGVPFINHKGSIPAVKRTYQLGARLKVGNNSILRVSFRKLRKVKTHYGRGELGDRESVVVTPEGKQHTYRAGVRRLAGVKIKPYEQQKEAKEKGYVLVDDVSDIVRVVLRWAGFKEWDIENTGMRLQAPLVFSNENFLIDMIKKCQEMTGFTFFMGGPSGNEERVESDDKDEYSIGVPIFRRPQVIQNRPRPGEPIEEVRDVDLLTGMQFRYDDDPLPYIIRVRGKDKPKKKGGKRLGTDRVRRLSARYYPSWTRRETRAGVIRHFTKTYHHLTSQHQCEVMARYISLMSALAATTATMEIPCNPSIWIDQHIGVRDLGTGLNTRLYLSNRSTHFRSGANAAWTMTLGGALIDIPDVQEELDELESVLAEGEPDHVDGPKKKPPKKKNAPRGGHDD